MSTTIESLMLLVGADVKPALAGLSKVKTGISSFATGSIGMVASGISSVFTGVDKVASLLKGTFGGDDSFAANVVSADNLSKSLGLNINALMGFSKAAKVAGVDTAIFEKGLQMYQKTLAQAEFAGEKTTISLEQFGLKLSDLKSMSFEDSLISISAAYSKLTTQTDKAQLAIAAFGKPGQKLMPLLERGPEYLKQFAAGMGITGEQADAIRKTREELDKFAAAKGMFSKQIVLTLAPIAAPIAEGLATFMKQFSDAIKDGAKMVQPIVGKLKTTLGPFIGKVATGGLSLLKKGIVFVMDVFSKGIPIVMQWWNVIGAGLEQVWGLIGRVADATSTWLGEFSVSGDFFGDLRDGAVSAFIGIEYGIRNIEKVWDVVIASIAYAGVVAWENIKHGWENLPEILLWAFDNARNIIKPFVIWAGGSFVTLFKTFWEAAGQAFEFIKTGGTSGFDVDKLLAPLAQQINDFQPFSNLQPLVLPDRVASGLELQLKSDLDDVNNALMDGWDDFYKTRWSELFGDKIPEAIAKKGNGIKDETEKLMKDIKFAGIAAFGSQEALQAVAKFRFEANLNDSNDPQKQLLDVQKKQLKQLEKIAGKGAPPVFSIPV